jgi:hypothetical protein
MTTACQGGVMRMIFFLIFLLSLVSCSQEDSAYVQTEGINARFEVIADTNNNTICKAVFRVGNGGIGGTYLELSGGDAVYCNGNKMYKREFLGAIEYRANVNYLPGMDYVFEFRRPEETHYANVRMPSAPVITSPSNYQYLAKNQMVQIRWQQEHSSKVWVSLASKEQYVHQNGIDYRNRTIGQSQSPEIGQMNLMPNFNFYAGNINSFVIVERTKYGSTPSALDGSISAKNSSRVDFTFID